MRLSQKEFDAFLLPERYSSLTVASKIKLPSKSNIIGSIDLNLTPYSILPVSLIGKELVRWIFVIAPTQSGKTVTLQVAVADSIDQAPGTAIYCLPDETSGKKQIREKIINMIEETPCLAKHIIQPSNRTLTSRGLHLDNMDIYLGWSNSPASLSSIPCKRVFLDELRLFKHSLAGGKESNAVKLLNDRMTTYAAMGEAQGYGVSTPSEVGDLLYEQTLVEGTTVLHFYTKCPKCGAVQILDFFKNCLNFTPKGVDKARVHCQFCEHEFSDRNMKRDLNHVLDPMSAYGVKGYDGDKVIPPVDLTWRMVFRYNSMVSPFRSFQEIYNEFNSTRHNINDYKNFVQCWLAEFWENKVSTVTRDDLLKSTTDYLKNEVPTWCKILTAGVDTQDNGFYVTVRAWGEGMRTHLIDNFFISHGIVNGTEEQLKKLFKDHIENRIYFTAKKEKWQIGLWGIDTGGHRTIELEPVLAEMMRVVPVKGRNTQDRTIEPSKNLNLFLVKTDIYAEETDIHCMKENWTLYKNIDDEFLNQWLSYKKVEEVHPKTGVKKIIWKKEGQNDYRMADIHAYICMDIIINDASPRVMINNKDWKYNPVIEAQIEVRNDERMIKENEDNDYMNYFSGDRDFHDDYNSFEGGYFG